MSVKYYGKSHEPKGLDGFTADEMKRNIHLVYADVECDKCGKAHHYAEFGKPCHNCGEKLK